MADVDHSAGGAPVAEDGAALVRRYLETVFSSGNLAAMDEFLSGEAFKKSVTALVRVWRSAFSDFRIDVEDVIAEGDRVVTVEILSGTHDGTYESSLGPVPATGVSARWSRISVRFLKDGRFVKGFFEEDEIGLLQQLGSIRLESELLAAHRATSQATGAGRDLRVLSDRAEPSSATD